MTQVIIFVPSWKFNKDNQLGRLNRSVSARVGFCYFAFILEEILKKSFSYTGPGYYCAHPTWPT